MVDQTGDVGVLSCPAPLVHTRALGQHAEVEAEQFIQILGGHRVVLAPQAVYEVHAGRALALRGILAVYWIGTATHRSIFICRSNGLG
ncbi:hypothetical protein D3C72_2258630 [compost metagenome]